MSVNDRIINFLSKTEGYNTFSAAQARNYFGITNVSARIAELRSQGYPIYTNYRTRADGTQVAVYRLGKPSKLFKAQLYARHGIKPRKVG